MNERPYIITADIDIKVEATSKKEAIKKAEELMKGLPAWIPTVHGYKLTHEKRTPKQNNAIHLYCTLLAQAFNEAGLDMKVVLKPQVDIEWSTESVKKYIWKPIQKSLLGTDSTTKLKKGEKEIDRVYDHINRHLSQRFAEWIPPILFPSKENQTKETKIDYPTYEGEPNFEII